ncbi:MAG: adenylate cyclase [Spirochaetes bacterium]|jgi:class 3 adenylate cyclase|nr:adenylate cyclase [Spirochaetota bacterium]
MESITEPTDVVRRNDARKTFLLKNIFYVIIGYTIPYFTVFFAKYFGIANYHYWQLGIYIVWTLGISVITYIITFFKKSATTAFGNTITGILFVNWLLTFIYGVSFLNEIRVVSLLLAIIVLIFLIFNSSFSISFIFTIAIAASYIAVSYYSIFIIKQKGDFNYELLCVGIFFPIGVFISVVAGQFKKQRKKIIKVTKNLEIVNKAVNEKREQMELLASKLAKYLSPQVYNSIFYGEKEVRVETYRKKLTIFFSDIKDFTQLTDSMESEALSNLLNCYLNEMSVIALNHGGTIDKFMGDGIMIFFGDPSSLGEKGDAIACLKMAIEMREKMRHLRMQWDREGISKSLKIRMGINSGHCTVGNFGCNDRLDYTIIGGQVNLASRLESIAEPDQILISNETYSLVKDEIECLKKDSVNVKGIAYPVQTYQVIDLKENLKKEKQELVESTDGISISMNFNRIERGMAIDFLKNIIHRLERNAEAN